MPDDQKRDLEALFTLRSWAWESFDRRRDYEWKVSIGLWTAQSALVGILLTTKDITLRPEFRGWFILFGFVLSGLHWYFRNGIEHANDHDRDRAETYEQEILQVLSLKDDVKQKLVASGFERQNYSVIFQVAVTVLLNLALIITVFVRS